MSCVVDEALGSSISDTTSMESMRLNENVQNIVFYMQPLGERRPSQQGLEEHVKEEFACEALGQEASRSRGKPRHEMSRKNTQTW